MRWGKIYKESDENDAQIAERLTGVSEELGATRAQVALAWLLSKPGIAAPIIGTSREEQLDELLNAVDITLKPEQIAELETPYEPASGRQDLNKYPGLMRRDKRHIRHRCTTTTEYPAASDDR